MADFIIAVVAVVFAGVLGLAGMLFTSYIASVALELISRWRKR